MFPGRSSNGLQLRLRSEATPVIKDFIAAADLEALQRLDFRGDEQACGVCPGGPGRSSRDLKWTWARVMATS
jgi:hypothetical protein